MARGGPEVELRSRRHRDALRARKRAEPPEKDIYHELLAEAARSSPAAFSSDDGRPIKRRKTAAKVEDRVGREAYATDVSRNASPQPVIRSQHVVIESSSDSDESDLDFEDVNFSGDEQDALHTGRQDPIIKDLSIDLDPAKPSLAKKPRSKRLATVVEKKLRVDIHKVHIVCLLYHVYIRNAWCEDQKVQSLLKPFLDARTVSLLHPKTSTLQGARSESFKAGLRAAVNKWKGLFRLSARGLKQPQWAASKEALAQYSLLDVPDRIYDLEDFRKAAQSCEGSRDLGAQLFCALLRAVDVDTRLICSLQPLPLTGNYKAATLVKGKQPMMMYQRPDSDAASSTADTRSASREPEGRFLASHPVPSPRRRLGQPSFATEHGPRPASTQAQQRHKPIIESKYPVYWIEAFDVAANQWTSVDPLVTLEVAKPSKLEPPASDPENSMSYVIAFEDDGTARDVTGRYARAYYAKTRRKRVEITKNGDRWFKRAMKPFRRRLGDILDRDQIEEAQINKRVADQPMPTNIQDFRDHPLYALERHLRRNEVIHPKRPCGTVSAGKTANNELESIYRRQDVQIVHSADKWYRYGREIRAGEQPLKHASPRKGIQERFAPENEEGEDKELSLAGVPLYAAFQTDLYIPPPVFNGKIPRNAFGNLDIYVPSMIPAGGIHLWSPDAAKAARLLAVDYADAVVGFQFKGRRGTAVIQGVVVADEYREAVESVVEGLKFVKEEEENARRTYGLLNMWKLFATKLLIKQGLRERHGPEPDEDEDKDLAYQSEVMEESGNEGGGFLPDPDVTDIPAPRPARRLVRDDTEEDRAAGFESDEDKTAGGFVAEDHEAVGDSVIIGNKNASGFVPEADMAAGGFILEENTSPTDFTPEEDDPADGFLDKENLPSATTAKHETSNSTDEDDKEMQSKSRGETTRIMYFPRRSSAANARRNAEENKRSTSGERPRLDWDTNAMTKDVSAASISKHLPSSRNLDSHCSFGEAAETHRIPTLKPFETAELDVSEDEIVTCRRGKSISTATRQDPSIAVKTAAAQAAEFKSREAPSSGGHPALKPYDTMELDDEDVGEVGDRTSSSWRSARVDAGPTNFAERSGNSHSNGIAPIPPTRSLQPPREQNLESTMGKAVEGSEPLDKFHDSLEDDRGSLLSEDPEDKDADPDWLADLE